MYQHCNVEYAPKLGSRLQDFRLPEERFIIALAATENGTEHCILQLRRNVGVKEGISLKPQRLT